MRKFFVVYTRFLSEKWEKSLVFLSMAEAVEAKEAYLRSNRYSEAEIRVQG